MKKKTFKCLTCNKMFASKESLNNHKRVHNKTYQCTVCLKCFTCKAALDVHDRTHTGEKPYMCSTCGKSFAQKSQLKIHQATHSGERKFKCMVCPDNRSFKTKDGLTKHMKFHDEPKYCCVICGKIYYTSSHLKRHEKTHLC